MTRGNWKSVRQVAQENDCTERTVQKWCEKNNVPYSGEGFRKTWEISPKYEAAFKKRPKPGRRWPEQTAENR